MLIIKVKNENLNRALNELKRKFVRTGILKEIYERQAYKKPSERRREQLRKAKYIQSLKDKANK